MKLNIKIFLAVIACFVATAARAQYYGVQIDAVCWNGDSTIYVASIASPTATKSKVFEYFVLDPSASNGIAEITVGSGSITPGPCGSTTTDVQNLLDNDTIISTLTAILTGTNKEFAISPVCWDSAGVKTTLLTWLQIDWSTNTVTQLYRNQTGAIVAPTVGTITVGECQANCTIADFEIGPGCWDSLGTLIPVQIISEYSGDTTTINYYNRNGIKTTATGAAVTMGPCGAIATAVSSQIIQNTLSTPSFPAGTEEVVFFNYSDAYLTLTTNIGAQVVGPNSFIQISGTNLSAVSLAATSGTFDTGEKVILNYSSRKQ